MPLFLLIFSSNTQHTIYKNYISSLTKFILFVCAHVSLFFKWSMTTFSPEKKKKKKKTANKQIIAYHHEMHGTKSLFAMYLSFKMSASNPFPISLDINIYFHYVYGHMDNCALTILWKTIQPKDYHSPLLGRWKVFNKQNHNYRFQTQF